MASNTAIVLRFSGIPHLTRRLHAMESAATDMRPAWTLIRDRFVAAEARTFAGEGGSSGKWAPLSPAYGAWKATHFGEKPILRRTDQLFRSLTSELSIDIRGPQTMILGTDVGYGRFHQTGTSKMPARKVIDLSEYERRMWVTIIRDHLMARDQTEGTGE
jgi:phage gpG-like protein